MGGREGKGWIGSRLVKEEFREARNGCREMGNGMCGSGFLFK